MRWPAQLFSMEVARDIVRRYSSRSMHVTLLIPVFLGCWPLMDGERNKFLLFARFVPYISIFGNIMHIFNSFYDVPLKFGDYPLLLEATIILVLTVKAILRLVFILFKSKDLKKFVKDLDELTANITDEREELIYQSYISKAKLFTIYFFAASISFSVVFSMTALLNDTRILPVHGKTPFDEIVLVTPVYEVSMVLVTLLGIEIAGANSLGDAFVFSIIMFMTSQCKILQHKLEHVREYAMKEVEGTKGRELVPTAFEEACIDAPWAAEHGSDVEEASTLATETPVEVARPELVDNLTSLEEGSMVVGRNRHTVIYVRPVWLQDGGRRSFQHGRQVGVIDGRRRDARAVLARLRDEDKRDVDEAMEKSIAECVRCHQALIGFFDLVQSEASFLLLFELCVNAIMTAIDLFQIATVVGTLQICLWVGFLLIHVTQIFAYCWCASELEKESVNLIDALYFSDWIESSASFKRVMQIIMSRALQPIQLRGASFLPFNMEVFANIMNSAYSYYGMVRKLQAN